MNISYTPEAEADLTSIHQYLSKYNTEKANEYIARILQSIRFLGSFPLIGRPGRVEGTRELSLSGLPYIVIYHIKNETDVEILAIKHERQRYP